MGTRRSAKVRVPPRWFVHVAWRVHRAIFQITGGRRGLWKPTPGQKWGTMRVTTTGRRSGQPQSVILAYFEDGPNLVTMAMNGWGEGHPAWWLNLQAHPACGVEIVGETRQAVAHRAMGEERDRLWAMWKATDAKLDDYAALRTTPTDLVVLEPMTRT